MTFPITPIIVISLPLTWHSLCIITVVEAAKPLKGRYFILHVTNWEPEAKGLRDLSGQQHADICAILQSLFKRSYEKNPTVRSIEKKMNESEVKKFILFPYSPWIALPYLNPISLRLILHIS